MQVTLGIDLCQDSPELCRLAGAWSERWRAHLHLVHVGSYGDEFVSAQSLISNTNSNQRMMDQHQINELNQSIPEFIRTPAQLVDGSVTEQLSAIASQTDILFVGTKPKGWLKGLWLGSVAEKMVRTSRSPTLVVKSSPSPGAIRALLAVDVRAGASNLIESALKWMMPLDVKIDLIYVEDVAPMINPFVALELEPLFLEQERQLRLARENRLQQLVEQIPETHRGKYLFELGKAEQVIPAHGSEYDLLICGSHSRSNIEHWFYGSVAERTVRRSPVSVLILRPGQ